MLTGRYEQDWSGPSRLVCSTGAVLTKTEATPSPSAPQVVDHPRRPTELAIPFRRQRTRSRGVVDAQGDRRLSSGAYRPLRSPYSELPGRSEQHGVEMVSVTRPRPSHGLATPLLVRLVRRPENPRAAAIRRTTSTNSVQIREIHQRMRPIPANPGTARSATATATARGTSSSDPRPPTLRPHDEDPQHGERDANQDDGYADPADNRIAALEIRGCPDGRAQCGADRTEPGAVDAQPCETAETLFGVLHRQIVGERRAGCPADRFESPTLSVDAPGEGSALAACHRGIDL